jgi:hypothetical protein
MLDRKSSRLTVSHHQRERLTTESTNMLNHEKFAPTVRRTQELMCYRDSRNH